MQVIVTSGDDVAVARYTPASGQQRRVVESVVLLLRDALQAEQKSKREGAQGDRTEIRLQQMRENLQGDHVTESSQTTRVRRRALRGLSHLRSKIQAQIRPQFAHRRMPEEATTHHGEERRHVRLHRKTRLAFFVSIVVRAFDPRQSFYHFNDRQYLR